MEYQDDHSDQSRLIHFDEGEDPLQLVPDGYEVIERSEPEFYLRMREFYNPGRLVCRPVKKEET